MSIIQIVEIGESRYTGGNCARYSCVGEMSAKGYWLLKQWKNNLNIISDG